MTFLYRVFLLLYPRSFQDAFAAEMAAVFAERASEYRKKGLLHLAEFVAIEATGLLMGSVRERGTDARLAPVVGGIVAAATLHWVLYAGTFKFLRAVTLAVGEAPLLRSGDGAGVLIGLCGVTAFLALLPVFFIMSMRLMQPGRQ